MTPIRLLARPMLASIFVLGGARALMDPEGHVGVARDVTEPLQDAMEGTGSAVEEASTDELVQIHGAAQLIGGLLLALGKLPRVAALLLAGSLVPTTLAAHRFWEEEDEQSRQAQTIHFFKNVSLLGGLLIASMDREGRPGLVWRAGHATDHAKLAADHAKEIAQLKAELAKKATSVDATEYARVRKELLKKQLTPDISDAKKLVDALRSDG